MSTANIAKTTWKTFTEPVIENVGLVLDVAGMRSSSDTEKSSYPFLATWTASTGQFKVYCEWATYNVTTDNPIYFIITYVKNN